MDEIVGQCRPEQAILNEEWMVSEIEDLHKKTGLPWGFLSHLRAHDTELFKKMLETKSEEGKP